MYGTLDQADVVLFVAVEFDQAKRGFGPVHAVLAFRIAHGPPPAGRLTGLVAGLVHAEIPHAKSVALFQHRAVKNGVSMVRRAFGPAAQHGIFRVLFSRGESELQVVLKGDAVIVKGKQDALFRGGREESRGKKADRERCGENSGHRRRMGSQKSPVSGAGFGAATERNLIIPCLLSVFKPGR